MSTASLYIHVPWCVRKCPYCDFNSHKSPALINENDYIHHLLKDYDLDVQRFGKRHISSIFIGGGTPSLFSPHSYERLLDGISKLSPFSPSVEITLEANPGTVEQTRFAGYRRAGINRLSLGIQSFNPKHLSKLGRIHDHKQAHKSIQIARNAGFENINVDIMHGLPEQTSQEAIQDLQQALSYSPEHVSWYQLTIEPNTVFYTTKPRLPNEETLESIETRGLLLLENNGYDRYEISAYCRANHTSKHNLNYWQFGDYFGIGAGAHGKLSHPKCTSIIRTQKKRQPKDYLNPNKDYAAQETLLAPEEICFEYMLNATRLERPFTFEEFHSNTGINIKKILPQLKIAKDKGLIKVYDDAWQITSLGRRFTNELQALFLDKLPSTPKQ